MVSRNFLRSSVRSVNRGWFYAFTRRGLYQAAESIFEPGFLLSPLKSTMFPTSNMLDYLEGIYGTIWDDLKDLTSPISVPRMSSPLAATVHNMGPRMRNWAWFRARFRKETFHMYKAVFYNRRVPVQGTYLNPCQFCLLISFAPRAWVYQPFVLPSYSLCGCMTWLLSDK